MRAPTSRRRFSPDLMTRRCPSRLFTFGLAAVWSVSAVVLTGAETAASRDTHRIEARAAPRVFPSPGLVAADDLPGLPDLARA